MHIVHNHNKGGFSRTERYLRITTLILYIELGYKQHNNYYLYDCEHIFDCVKNILRNPEDCKNMKKDLEELNGKGTFKCQKKS